MNPTYIREDLLDVYLQMKLPPVFDTVVLFTRTATGMRTMRYVIGYRANEAVARCLLLPRNGSIAHQCVRALRQLAYRYTSDPSVLEPQPVTALTDRQANHCIRR